jgi:hypothetical protein
LLAASTAATGTPHYEQRGEVVERQAARARRTGAVVVSLGMGVALAVAGLGAGERALAGMSCDLAPELGVRAEQRRAGEAGGPGVVAVAETASGLRAGDAIRQANAVRVETCLDLERAAAEALAKGIALLLAVERMGGVTLVRVPPAAETRAAAAPAAGRDDDATLAGSVPAAPPAATVRDGAGAPPAGAPVNAHGAPDAAGAAAPVKTDAVARAEGAVLPAAPDPARAEAPIAPLALRALALPPSADAAPEVRAAAAAAVGDLRQIDATAQLSVPLPLYERRLEDAERSIAALAFGPTRAGAAVRAAIEDLLGIYRSAGEIRRATLEYLQSQGVQSRGAAATSVPYFSDSKVPEWVARYPFLRSSLRDAPRATRFLLPGEAAGRWDPDQASELLWARAREESARLAAWAEGG